MINNISSLFVILGLTMLFSCSESKTKNFDHHKSTIIQQENQFIISAIDATFPLKLDKINFSDESKIVQLNDRIISKIENTIKEYALDIEFYDSTLTYKDTYINTIRLHDSLQTIFLVLLKHPSSAINSKILFYDNQRKEFSENTFDFNLHALYKLKDKRFEPSNLKTGFKITHPEIERLDFNEDGIKDYKFVRLWHNGTYNSLQTTILSVKQNRIDTLHFAEDLL
ncbi:MAG: hypothetical protein COA58_10585 [Bacteroidetes bacterium]|nr:MAG: hypothetical protein COA58_10585 [Bacteroidota bacterium]